MFDTLSDRLSDTFRNISGKGKISEKNIQDALAAVRRSFLEADVNLDVTKKFIDRVREQALGAEVHRALSPDQHFIKLVYDEMVDLLGGADAAQDIALRARPPSPVMMVGLQGSGKTTTTGKVANMLQRQGKSVYLVPADVARPAAIEQLTTLAGQLNAPVYPSTTAMTPLDIVKHAVDEARSHGADVMLVDTAGRLHVDQELMDELVAMADFLDPTEMFLVADAMTGQEAVHVAETFHETLALTGVILTKMEGDARGGAALSIKTVTGVPLRFVGIGEKLNQFETFYPDRVASRILGMGDMLSFVEKAQEAFDEKKAEEMEKRLRKNAFTLEDYREALTTMRRMGSFEQIAGMIPGMKNMLKGVDDFGPAEQEMKKTEAIISSMTPGERSRPEIIKASRRKRIAAGSGTTVQDVNRVLKNHKQMKQMMGRINKMGMKGMAQMLKGGGGMPPMQ